MYRTYIIKLWLSTMVVTPVAFVILNFLFDPDTIDLYSAVQMIFFIIFFGLIMSIPTLLFVDLVSVLVAKKFKEPAALKTATILLSIFGVVVSFVLIYDSSSDQLIWGLILAFLYIFFIVFFGLIYKPKLK